MKQKAQRFERWQPFIPPARRLVNFLGHVVAYVQKYLATTKPWGTENRGYQTLQQDRQIVLHSGDRSPSHGGKMFSTRTASKSKIPISTPMSVHRTRDKKRLKPSTDWASA